MAEASRVAEEEHRPVTVEDQVSKSHFKKMLNTFLQYHMLYSIEKNKTRLYLVDIRDIELVYNINLSYNSVHTTVCVPPQHTLY